MVFAIVRDFEAVFEGLLVIALRYAGQVATGAANMFRRCI